jgi:DNA-binding FrmR family transcriptional regulator
MATENLKFVGKGRRPHKPIMSHSPEDPEADRRALQVRLRKITGQLRGVEKMVAGDYDCAEVLNQLVSARRGLKSLAEKIINDHLQHCLEEPVRDEDRRRQLREVAMMLKRYVD